MGLSFLDSLKNSKKFEYHEGHFFFFGSQLELGASGRGGVSIFVILEEFQEV
jgi:hypothetical protein